MLTIDNLNTETNIDQHAGESLRGGYWGNYLASFATTTNVFTQNATAINIGAGNGGLVSVGSLSLTPVSAGSAMTWLQSA
ncbi:MAG: hypothetical protein AB8B93_05925 [Pseudomonadales bacterium]